MSRSVVRRSSIRRAAAVAAGASMVAGSMLMAAPFASAVPTAVTIQPGAGANNDRYGVGCSYAVTVTVDGDTPTNLAMAENVPGGEWELIGVIDTPAPGAYVVEWVPPREGSFRLNANQAGVGTSTHNITVTRGINLGSSTCLVL
ncbi:MAG: hypothetical protein GX542_14040 [Rhodococcus sp.]|nr:hypothetical protein [Rhodococcus sp. (in: high G+C Gram-positive bacteria)]